MVMKVGHHPEGPVSAVLRRRCSSNPLYCSGGQRESATRSWRAIEPPSSVYHRLPFAYREMLCHCRSFPYPPLPAPVVFCTKFTHSYHVHSITDQFPFYFNLDSATRLTYKFVSFFLSLLHTSKARFIPFCVRIRDTLWHIAYLPSVNRDRLRVCNVLRTPSNFYIARPKV